jgi:NADPH:quinone reductase-like Zn-dependent oxidoreductase
MKAIVYHRYGSPDVLQYEEVEKPTPGVDEVLIKIRAASVNPVDRIFRGTSYLARVFTGLRKPRDIRVGVDVAGQVEAVGRNVTEFKPEDEVFGFVPWGLCRVCVHRPVSIGHQAGECDI